MSDNIKKLLFTDATGTLYSVTLGIDGVPIDASTIAYISRDNHFSETAIFDKTVTLKYTPQNETDATTKTYVDTQIKNCVPSGTLRMWAGKTIPDGYLLCNGQGFNILQYPDLFDAIGYTYGGSGNTANVPNLNDRTIWCTTDTNSVGIMLKDGLPNVSGITEIGGFSDKSVEPSGPFRTQVIANNADFQRIQTNFINIETANFDASRSSAIYKAISKVSVRSCYALMIIKA